MRRGYWLTVLGIGLMLMAWVTALPRFGAPDEASHYLKAVASARGQVFGEAPVSVREGIAGETTRAFDLPPAQEVDTNLPCFAFKPEVTADCVQPPGETTGISLVGTYAPFVYALLGVPANLAGDASLGLYSARAANALLNLLLIAGALRLATTRRMRVAVLLGAAPMTVFLSSAVNPNATEITGALCMATASFALIERPNSTVAWSWWCVGGSACALSKSLGPVWVALILGLTIVVAGRGLARRLSVEARARWWAPSGLLAAMVAQVLWTAIYMPKPEVPLAYVVSNLLPAARSSKDYLGRGTVGIFGWLDVRLEEIVYISAAVLLLCGGALALRAGSWRLRAALVGWGGVVLLVSAYVTVSTQWPFGFGGQARFTLALVAVLWLLMAHTMDKRPVSIVGPLLAAGLVAGLQVLSFHQVARRYAVGLNGQQWFLSEPDWSPPVGWAVPVLFVLLGAALLVAGQVLDGSSVERDDEPGGVEARQVATGDQGSRP